MNQGGFNQSEFNRTDSAADSATPELVHQLTLDDAPFLTGFTSCKSHVIAATEEQTNYPVRVVIHRSAGTDSGQDVYVGASGCLATYADIRFTAADGSTLLEYAFPPDIATTSTQATVDVLVPTLIAGNTTIRIYYGDATATDASDANATYLFHDTFPGSALDETKWTPNAEDGITVTSSVLTIASSSAPRFITSKTKIPENSILTARLKTAHSGYVGTTGGEYLSLDCYVDISYEEVIRAMFSLKGDAPRYRNYNGSASSTTVMLGWDAGNYHVLELTRAAGSTWLVDGSNSVNDTADYVTTDCDLILEVYGSARQIDCDYVYVRKYISTVTHGAWATVSPTKIIDSYTSVYTNETYLYFTTGSVAFVAGENITGATSGSMGVVKSIVLVSGTWAGGNAQGYMVVVGATLPFVHENLTGHLGGTAHTEGRTVSVSTYDYSSGSAFFTAGETVTGGTSGNTGVVASFTFTSGDAGAGTAAGTVTLIDSLPGWITHEVITGSVSGVATIAGGFYQVSTPLNTTSVSISKRLGDSVWIARMEMAGVYISPTDMICDLSMVDHLGVVNSLFSGVVPDQEYTFQEARNRTTVTGYSDAWYLSRQYLNRDYPLYVYNPVGSGTITPSPGIYMDSTLAEGCETHVNPRLLCTQFFTDAGMTVGVISDSTPWSDGSLKQSEFKELGVNSTKLEALQTIGDYISFYLHESFSGGASVGYFISNDDIDTLLGLPSPLTLSNPTEYIIGPIQVEKRKGELYNRVVVRGKPVMITDTVTISSTSNQTIALSQLGISGTIGIALNGTNFTTFTENLSGSDVTSVSLTGIPATGTALICFMPATKYYETVWESSALSDPGARVIQAPPYESDDLQTQAMVDAYCNALVTFYNTDPNVYHVTFSRRADLRLLQKVTLTGFPGIPETAMRIVAIDYQQKGPFVQVVCELSEESHLSAQRRLKRITALDNVAFIRAIVEQRLKVILAEEPTVTVLISGIATIAKNIYNHYRKGTLL